MATENIVFKKIRALDKQKKKILRINAAPDVYSVLKASPRAIMRTFPNDDPSLYFAGVLVQQCSTTVARGNFVIHGEKTEELASGFIK